MSNYQDVLRRLTAYRKRIGMTQVQLAERMDISQEQYSYLENGVTKLTGRNLNILLESGWNVDYIITGDEFDGGKTELEEAFDSFGNGKEKEFIMKLCAEIMIERAGKYYVPKKRVQENLVLLDAMLKSWHQFSMIYFVRQRMDLTQIAMAEKLGVGIKKYRELEREVRYPDAEMLLGFYDMSGYRPMLFLDFYDRRLLLIKQIWSMLTSKEKKVMLEFVRYMRTML